MVAGVAVSGLRPLG